MRDSNQVQRAAQKLFEHAYPYSFDTWDELADTTQEMYLSTARDLDQDGLLANSLKMAMLEAKVKEYARTKIRIDRRTDGQSICVVTYDGIPTFNGVSWDALLRERQPRTPEQQLADQQDQDEWRRAALALQTERDKAVADAAEATWRADHNSRINSDWRSRYSRLSGTLGRIKELAEIQVEANTKRHSASDVRSWQMVLDYIQENEK